MEKPTKQKTPINFYQKLLVFAKAWRDYRRALLFVNKLSLPSDVAQLVLGFLHVEFEWPNTAPDRYYDGHKIAFFMNVLQTLPSAPVLNLGECTLSLCAYLEVVNFLLSEKKGDPLRLHSSSGQPVDRRLYTMFLKGENPAELESAIVAMRKAQPDEAVGCIAAEYRRVFSRARKVVYWQGAGGAIRPALLPTHPVAAGEVVGEESVVGFGEVDGNEFCDSPFRMCDKPTEPTESYKRLACFASTEYHNFIGAATWLFVLLRTFPEERLETLAGLRPLKRRKIVLP